MADETEYVDKLLVSVNDAARNTRNVLLVFLLAGLYFAILIGATTDEQFLRESSINLPLLNVTLPIVGFYVAAGPIYVILHFNLLLQFYMLSRRIRRFRDANSSNVAQGGPSRWILLFPLPYSEAFAPQDGQSANARDDDGHHGLIGWLLRTMTWLMAIGIPIFLLLWMQIRFLAYQSEVITWLHRSMLLLDVGMIAALLPILDSHLSHWRVGIQWAFRVPFKAFITERNYAKFKRILAATGVILGIGLLSALFLIMAELYAANVAVSPVSITAIGGLAAMLALLAYIPWRGGLLTNAHYMAKSTIHVTVLLAVLGASILVGVVPGSWQDENLPLYLTGALLDGEEKFIRRHLVIRDKLLIAAPPPDATIERYLNTNRSRDIALRDHAVGLVLVDCNLRLADFRGSELYNANFNFARMQGADLSFTSLQRAKLRGATLQGVDLRSANLEGANLSKARMQGANLSRAILQGADLTLARLQGADLRRAKLQGADLSFAKLQGANLWSANLRGADLSSAKLQGAELSHARLLGANLRIANLEGAKLNFARLQGADFRAANLQGAEFYLVSITGADFDAATRLPITDWQELIKVIKSSVSHSKRRKMALDRIDEASKRGSQSFDSLHGSTVDPTMTESFIGNVPHWMKSSIINIRADIGDGFQVLTGDSFRQRRAFVLANIACLSGSTAAEVIATRDRRTILVFRALDGDPYFYQAIIWHVEAANGFPALKKLGAKSVFWLRDAIEKFVAAANPTRKAQFREFQKSNISYIRRHNAPARKRPSPPSSTPRPP